MTFVITTGGIDLSVGSRSALVNALAAIALQAGLPWPRGRRADAGAGRRWSAPSRAGSSPVERIPAFIVTLAGLSILRGVALLLTQGYSIPIAPTSWFVQLGRGWFLGHARCRRCSRSWSRWPANRAQRQTASAATSAAMGANAEAARRAGIAVRRVTLARLCADRHRRGARRDHHRRPGSARARSNAGRRLRARGDRRRRAGRHRLIGGRGTIVGTVLGALTIAVIGNGLILAHISPFFTQIVTGLIILVAIWLNTRLFARLAQIGADDERARRTCHRRAPAR